MPLAVGDTLPPLDLTTPDGAPWPQPAGQALVLFFFPKADTPGCTNEAKDFSALMPRFAAAGVRVVGVSRDEPKKLAKFAAKHDLTVELGADTTGAVTDAFGVWVEKAMYGRTYMGIDRTTVLVAADGTIARIWPKVKVKGHADDVLAAAAAL